MLRYGGRLIVAVLAVALLVTLTVGLPWSLTRFVGWPLPHQIPSWDEVQATLTQPASTSLMVNALSCILWPAWALFTIDVGRAVADQLPYVTRPRLPIHRGPVQAAAAALVGAVLLSVLASRSPSALAVGATSSTSRVPTMPGARPTLVPAAARNPTIQLDGSAGQPATGRAVDTVEVQPPHHGVHDSLWRIAERTLGDGTRWPEIYLLNRGRPQPDGHTLASPSLIRPGWILRLPDPPRPPASPHREPPASRRPVPHGDPPHSSAPQTSRPPSTPSAGTAAPAPGPSTNSSPHTSSPTTPRPRAGHGLDLPTGAFVSGGLAALVATALLTVRRRRRRNYRPGSGDRTDLTIAPVVRALRTAHEDVDDETRESELPPRTNIDGRLASPGPAAEEPPTGTDIGVKDGRPLAWNLAGTRGLGLIGPGAHDAARALLVSLLAERAANGARHATMLMPTADAHQLFGTDDLPAVQLADTFDAALDVLETELLARLRASADTAPPDRTELVLIATSDEHDEHRLQAILDNGSPLGLAGILLGQWRPGGTVRVRADGTVAATSPTLDTLTDARLFTLPATDATDLLELLHQAQPEAAAVRPPAPRTPESAVHPRAPLVPPPLQQRPERRRLGLGRATPPTAPAPDQPEPPQPEPPTASLSPHNDEPADEPDPSPRPAPAPNNRTQPPAADPRPWHLTVLGRIHLTHHQPDGAEHADASPALAPKHREVLTYLALHPHGARREALADAIWPHAPTDRPYNSFHATMSQLRRALRAAAHDEHLDITTHSDDGRYTLDPTAIDVDLWQLHTALDEARHPQGFTDAAAFDHALALYQGDLAADLTAEWLEAPREALRRDVLDLISNRARILRDPHPDQALTLLEHARTLDPFNEAVYRAIARLQARLAQWEAIPRTHALLTTTLTTIGEDPGPETEAFFTALQRPAPQHR